MLREIVPPSDCPSCGSNLQWINQLLYCKSTVCGAQKQKKIEHFAKTLKIKGLGPAAIEKLDIQDFDQLYELDVDYITSALNSEKIAIKLKKEIDNSKSAPLNLVLPAFGIPLIGNTATKKLSETVENITEINADTCKRAGLGPKATENLMSWLSKDFYAFYDGCLPFDFKFVTEQKVERKGVVCISGRLKSFKTKADATETLSSLGYEVKSSLTKDVTILVNESGIESAKTKQARDSGVNIVTNLKEFLGEH
jgi:NAD-dependent DNA ligase